MPTGLTDLEITRACAKAMGLDALTIEQSIFDYDPLHDDAQAMALGKKHPEIFEDVVINWAGIIGRGGKADLNRMLCTAMCSPHTRG